MTTKFSQSWQLFKASITVTLRYRKLLWFPLLTTILTIFIAFFFLLAMGIPAVLYSTGHHSNQTQHRVALENSSLPAPAAKPSPKPAPGPTDFVTTAKNTFVRTLTSHSAAAKTPGHPIAEHVSPLESVITLVAYFLAMFLATFFNVAFYHEIIEALNGREVSFRRGLSVAWSRLPAILAWSLLAGVVGWLIRTIEERVPFAARIVTGLLGMLWSVAAVFAIPVIIQQQSMGNPLKVLQQSALTLKRTWGEGLIGYLGFSAANTAIFLVSLLPLLVAGGIALFYNSVWVIAIAAVIWLAVMLCIGYVSRVAGHVFRCALYIYAAEGAVPEPYDQHMLDTAWKVKRGSQTT